MKTGTNENPSVSIIMGSDSDLKVMSKCAEMLEDLKVPFELTIVSAHRTPERLYEFAKNAEARGIKVIIAAAGGAAHLAGMTASITALPVIGVPVMSKTLSGVDSLYSIVQMPPGIPVATVAINGAENAALLAAKIVGINDLEIMRNVKIYSENLRQSVLKKAERLETEGFRAYIEKNL